MTIDELKQAIIDLCGRRLVECIDDLRAILAEIDNMHDAVIESRPLLFFCERCGDAVVGEDFGLCSDCAAKDGDR